MAKRRKTEPASRAMDHTLEAVPWAIEFANTSLSEENWKDHLWRWFGVTVEPGGESAPEPAETHPRGKRSPQWHYGGMVPTLAHIHRTQESIRETLKTLADKGTVPRDVVERVNSYLMGLHGFKFHITSDISPDADSKAAASGPDASGNGKGVQPRTLRLEPKTFDLRSLFYYRFSLFLISAAAQRVRKCKQCDGHFIQRFNHRKLYCGDLCRFRSHNRSRTPKRAAGRKRAAQAPPPDSHVWWRKYEGESTPD
ncbi:MAG: hypothetical protein QGG90_05170 [Nitrospinota bacterium]|jgi:hypothetical protein|nr:hypothetical protein [Nitrospinota bacterium]